MFAFLRRRSSASADTGRLDLGAEGERQARRHLRRCGYRILARNYRCPHGELDLIALDGDTIVFVEVRTRTDADESDPHEWVGPAKWRQVHRVARYYLHERDAHDRPCRFDLVAVLWPEGGRPLVHHYPEAHTPRS